MKLFLAPLVLLSLAMAGKGDEIRRIWLTHQSNEPSKLVVNWETPEAADSVVEFGETAELGKLVKSDALTTLHHVAIPLGRRGVPYHYRIRSGTSASAVHTIQGYPEDELRVAVFADAGYMKASWGEAIAKERPHLMISAGDHVPALHKGQPVPEATTTTFSQLVDRYPELFSSTPWMPLLGNHDREIRPRGATRPEVPVYDVEATAFRSFFALPGEEWKWHFDVLDFGVRFIALDLSHLSDQGTTWQTCHSPKREEAQFSWYRDLMTASEQPFVITFYNEKNSTVRGLEGGEWGKWIAKGSMAITGFGYFAERADVDGFSYYNTSVGGTGAPYRDAKSAFFKSEDNFLLLTFRRATPELVVDLKNLAGGTLESRTFRPRMGSTLK